MTSVRHRRSQPRSSGWRGVLASAALLAAVLSIAGLVEPAFAQDAPTGILAPGNAVVTGFSGAVPPAQIAPGVDPGEKTFIDLNGPSLRINDLQTLNGPPIAQLVAAPKPFTATAAQIGQVFSVTLDNNVPPNIYAAATSAYGVPLVAAGQDGQPIHVKRGAPNVNFMPGLWGPASLRGGPGAIWKIDSLTGAVSLFAYVTLDGAPTTAAALGGIAYHQESNSIFAVARDTGLIQRFTVGAVRGRYDHGVQGRQAQGLPPVPYDATKRSNIKSPQFDSEDPNTWGYAPPERRIFGIGIYRDRLYYAVADGLQIWSVGISPDGSFGNDATVEINVPPGSGPTEISKITFDEQGRMYLAERPDPTGAYDFEALTQEGVGRVLRYALVESYPGAPRVWQPIPDEYAVGFPPPNYRNGDGGVAIGYSYDEAGLLDRGSCGGFLWSTGTRLRKSDDAVLAARLKLLGPENVDGLQGNEIDLVLPQNAPPLTSYFIDFDDRFDDDAARGHTGDVTIWRVCGPVLRGGWMLPGWIGGGGGSLWFPPPHKQQCPPDQKKPGYQCCPKGSSPDASGACKPWCPNGAMDQQSVKFCGLGFDQTSFDPNDPSKLKCIGGGKPDPAKGIAGCAQASPQLNAPVCQAGWAKQNVPGFGNVCAPTPQQKKCGPGEQVSSIDNKCHALCTGGTAWPITQCCAPGSVVSSTGQCCPAGSKPDPKTGACLSPPKKSCPPDQVSKVDGACCPIGQTPNNVIGGCCPAGQTPAPGTGVCQQTSCPTPNKKVGSKCCSPADLQPGGACTNSTCVPTGANNYCCHPSNVYKKPDGAQACCLGKVVNGKCEQKTGGGGPGGTPGNSKCIPGSNDPSCCANGYQPTGNACCLASQVTSKNVCCPAGQSPSGPKKDQCQPSKTGWIPPWHFGNTPPDGGRGTSTGTNPTCPFPICGIVFQSCCAPGLIPAADGSCCPPNLMTRFGTCCPADSPPDASGTCPPPNPKSEKICAKGYTKLPDGTCCLNSLVGADNKSCRQGADQPRKPLIDCSARGPNFIRGQDNSRACERCPRGQVSNADQTKCVLPGQGSKPRIIGPNTPPPPPPPPRIKRPGLKQPGLQRPQIKPLRPALRPQRCVVVRGKTICN